jgi:hypothetical protein
MKQVRRGLPPRSGPENSRRLTTCSSACSLSSLSLNSHRGGSYTSASHVPPVMREWLSSGAVRRHLRRNHACYRGYQCTRKTVSAPKANMICDRFIGSVRRECLDHILILRRCNLPRLGREYVDYFTHACPRPGEADGRGEPQTLQPIMAIPILGGLHHHDCRHAA